MPDPNPAPAGMVARPSGHGHQVNDRPWGAFVPDHLREGMAELEEAYTRGDDDDHPLGGYLVLLACYGGLVAGLGGLVAWRRPEVPATPAPGDLALLAVATHKLSRILTKDPVTSPLRAPFTRFERPTGKGEVAEQTRGAGLRHAIGELVTCPFCTAQWVATVLSASLVVAPRLTRRVAGVFCLTAGSDLLQLAYAKALGSVD